MGSQNPKVVALESPQAYFQELVHEAMSHQKIAASEEAEFYLVNLLNEFIDATRLFQSTPDGLQQEPLALMLARALRSNRHHRIQILKRLGDTTLYIAGFFPESVHRKIVDIGYYIQMGGTAYHTVSTLSEKGIVTELFEELSEKFVPLVDILSEISDKSMLKVNPDILHLYELWLNTGSERIEQILQEYGITPHKDPGLKTVQ